MLQNMKPEGPVSSPVSGVLRSPERSLTQPNQLHNDHADLSQFLEPDFDQNNSRI